MRSARERLHVEVLGARASAAAITPAQVRSLCRRAAARSGLERGHVAVHFVDAARIAQLNREHRGRDGPTDVLSFPVDGLAPLAVEDTRELGDIVICPAHTVDQREAVVHGMLHLIGMDHETDDGEMLLAQDELLARSRLRR